MGGRVTDCAGTCVADYERLCGECWDRLAARLRGVPGLGDELEVTITRQDKVSAGRVGGRGTETPLPFNAGASISKTHLRYFLGTWCRDVADYTGAALPTAVVRDVVSDAATWLLEHEGGVRNHPAADDLCEELGEAVYAAVRAIDRPADRVFAGWCCVVLYARPGAEGVRCRECGQEYEVDAARQQLLTYLPDQKGTSSDVSTWLSWAGARVPAGTIRRWASEGRIPRHGGLYRVGDVLDVISATSRPNEAQAS